MMNSVASHGPYQEPQPPYPESITKDEINELHLRRYAGPVELVQDDEASDRAIKALAKEEVLGFDTETRPAFRKGESYLPSLVQLGGTDTVYIFQLSRLSTTKKLFRLLANPRVLKVGVATDFDVKQLQELQSFQPAGFVNIESLTGDLGIRNNGLRSLSALVMGFRLSKSEQRSNWSRDPLSRSQIVYAATDAWVSREIYLRLIKALNGKNGGAPLRGE